MRTWCRTWPGPPASRATCWPRGGRCRCSNRATTRRLLDTGAYYFAHHYAYNSLARPGIYGFVPSGSAGGGGAIAFAVVREPQTVAEIVAESGGAHASALTTLDPTGSPSARP